MNIMPASDTARGTYRYKFSFAAVKTSGFCYSIYRILATWIAMICLRKLWLLLSDHIPAPGSLSTNISHESHFLFSKII
jgi:hypothetical protein